MGFPPDLTLGGGGEELYVIVGSALCCRKMREPDEIKAIGAFLVFKLCSID